MNTPDTEWSEAFDKEWLETGCNSYGVATKGVVKDMFARLLTSRDTYWKERVISVVEKLKKENENSEDYKCGEHWSTYGYPKALDTLLENLIGKE